MRNAVVRTFTNPKEMKAEEYRYWQSRPVHERIRAVSEMARAAFGMKGTPRMFEDFQDLLSAFNTHGRDLQHELSIPPSTITALPWRNSIVRPFQTVQD